MTKPSPTERTLPAQKDPFVVHSDGTVEYANETCLSLLGSESPDEIIGKPLLSFVRENYHETLTDHFHRIRADEAEALGVVVEIAPLHGSACQIVMVTSPVEWNETMMLQTTLLDISQQLAVEPLFERAMNAAPVGITIADANKSDEPLVYVSEEFAKLTGYSEEEVLGQNCRLLQGEGTEEEPVAKMRAAIDAKESVSVVLRNYRADGSMFWNRVTIIPITGKDATVTHFLGYQEDVSEMKLYQQEKTIYQKHAEAAPYAMFITDREGIIQHVNPAFERTTGYTAKEAVGRNPRLLKSDQQDEAFYEKLWGTITAGDVWTNELTNQKKSGELYRVNQTIVPIQNEYQEITHFVAIERDISETEFNEQVFDVINRVLRHNLRTSINVIEGYVEILNTNIDTPTTATAVEAITKRTEALKQLSQKTNQIRELIETRDQHHVINLKGVTDYIDNCHREYPELTIDLSVSADNELQIKNGELLNLAIRETIENAVTHNDSDEPLVTITIHQIDGDDKITIEIADNGPGIPKEEWDVIVANEETSLQHGSGIGLWLIYWGITGLGGTVELTQNTAYGSTLTFRIPVIHN
ncbi:PAS domain-containing protein [Halonotius sp. GCM10025705]|uniref:PAS domain-containing protein n=1 Tax=Halonotius sp. GCM10025705 TaxID=3252678 RepID=UPI003611D25E